MGCDIHCYVEVKTKDGIWHLYNQPSLRRDYEVFARMADVRNNFNITPISETRGLPEDISVMTKIEAEHIGTDGHSHSWFSAKEVDELVDWMRERWPDDRGLIQNPFGYICGGTFSNNYGDEDRPYVDVRLVFWFDN